MSNANTKIKRVNFNMPIEVYKKVRHASVENNISFTEQMIKIATESTAGKDSLSVLVPATEEGTPLQFNTADAAQDYCLNNKLPLSVFFKIVNDQELT